MGCCASRIPLVPSVLHALSRFFFLPTHPTYCTTHCLSVSVPQLSQTAALHSLLLRSEGHSAAEDIWKTADTLFAPWLTDIEKEKDKERDAEAEAETEGSDTDLGLNLDSANIAETATTPSSEAGPLHAPVSEAEAVPVPASVTISPPNESSSPLNIVLSGASWLFKGSSR
jgi:hypothetical protein